MHTLKPLSDLMSHLASKMPHLVRSEGDMGHGATISDNAWDLPGHWLPRELHPHLGAGAGLLDPPQLWHTPEDTEHGLHQGQHLKLSVDDVVEQG